MTLDNLNTQKTELHTNPYWQYSRNQTLSLVPPEQNLQKFIFDNSKPHCIEQCLCFLVIIALPFFRFSVIGSQLYLLRFPHIVIVIYKVLFSFSWPAGMIIETIYFYFEICLQLRRLTQNNQWKSLWCSWAKTHHFLPPWSNLLV